MCMPMLIFGKPKGQSDTSSQWKTTDIIFTFFKNLLAWVELEQIAPDQAQYLNNLKNLALAIKVFQTSQSALGIN